jgi:hypothetical protein
MPLALTNAPASAHKFGEVCWVLSAVVKQWSFDSAGVLPSGKTICGQGFYGFVSPGAGRTGNC